MHQRRGYHGDLKFGRQLNMGDALVQMDSACRKQIAGSNATQQVAGDICRPYSELFEDKHAKALRRS